MKTLLLFILMLASAAYGQDFVMTFTCGDGTMALDSINATNLRTGEAVSFAGNDTLLLKAAAGIPHAEKIEFAGVAYPNPFTGQTAVEVDVQTAREIVLYVSNSLGQIIARTREYVVPGRHRFALSVNTAGNYTVTVQGGQDSRTLQLVSTGNGSGNASLSYLGSGNLTRQKSLKTSEPTLPSLEFILGDCIRYRCMGDRHTTIFQEEPRGSKEYQVDFYPCLDDHGQCYPVVKIGEQIWMAKNLAWLPSVDYFVTQSDTDPHYYVYGYDGTSVTAAKETENFARYGVLYNWPAALTACPDGWHLPTDAEFWALERFLGVSAWDNLYLLFRITGNVGEKLKSETGWINDGGGTNRVGFNGIPGGYRSIAGFFELGNWLCMWSSTPDRTNYSVGHGLGAESNGVYAGPALQRLGYSVRCIKDE